MSEPTTNLLKKLDFKEGESVYVEYTPDWYSEFARQSGFILTHNLPSIHAHLFFRSREELSDFLGRTEVKDIKKSMWVSWPKKSGQLQSDLSENHLRSAIQSRGWVDIKVAAIDDNWSGLRFVRRKS